jgi:hypothetical protein
VKKNFKSKTLFGKTSNPFGVCTFDLHEELYRNEFWTQGEEPRKHLKAMLLGDVYKDPTGFGKDIDYGKEYNELNALYKAKNAKFIELVGHYTTLEDANTVRGNKTVSKTVIMYVYIGNS